MIDKGVCDRPYIWDPSNCECEYEKSCDVGEYLDYKNCKCRKRLVHKSVEESNEIVEEVKIVIENKNKCSSCIFYVALFSIFFTNKLESLLISFTTDTLIIIKKIFLNMIMFIKQKVINHIK